ncbi:hypothetical protein GGR44_001356 [Sphingobium fontiphilum]|uniref:DUF4402 domain-containing protein n=1 Tax=Sphingobium fontiphilum TaxID=944425 RepID=A0A7W6GQ50_9SPHN|nr:DUF4402 domain-containing protein [Sphingobium fontiphilum]MBB3981709.1 hypothetical protein [Sphingobium fontiphilum]
MNKLIVKGLGLAGMVSAAGMITAPAHATSATGDATVKILQAITVAKSSDLNFGKVLASSTASTVAIAESGTRTCGSGLSCYGTTTAGAFNVTGSTGETVSVAIDNPTITLSDGGANAMTVALNTSTSSMTLAGGTGSFKIAGTLNVGANQAAGTYAGQYSVSVNYQ